MPRQTQAEVELELAEWYRARREAALGHTVTITTSQGTKSITRQDLDTINQHILSLERRLDALNGSRKQDYKLANFNHSGNG